MSHSCFEQSAARIVPTVGVGLFMGAAFFFAASGYALENGGESGETAAAAEDGELVSMILLLLGDADRQMRALAYEQIRNQAPGPAATRRFAAQLDKLPPEGQVGLLAALTDRGDTAARPAVIGLLEEGPADVQVAAVRALGPLGDTSDVPRLVALLSHDSQAMRSAAQASLVRLGGSDVTVALVRQTASADAQGLATIFDILVERRAREAIPLLLFAAICDDPALRRPAMQALEELAGPGEIPGMVRGLLAAEPGSEREAAERCIAAVCARIEEAGAQAVPLLAVVEKAGAADRTVLLSVVGRVGGPRALKAVEAALGEEATHAAALRALCNWPSADVAPRLIELVESDLPSEQRIAALRALIRVAPLPDQRSDDARLALLTRAMAMAARDEERRLALDRAKAIRTVESLRFALDYLDHDQYSEHACQTVVELAHHRGLRDAHEAEFHAALNRVLETSEDATVQARATAYLNNETWVRPE